MPIKSGGTNSVSKAVGMAESSQTKPYLFLDELEVDVTGTIVVMIGRGNMIHSTAKARIEHNFLRIKEGDIYLINKFMVLPNKDGYWIFKHDKIMLEFDGETTVRKVFVNGLGFLRYPFQLIDFDRIEPANNKYLIGSRNLDFYLANQRGLSLRVTLWGGLGDALIERKTKHYSAESLLGAGEDEDDESSLPTAIRNLIGTTHVLEIKSHTYYEYGTFESFTCWKVNPSEMVADGASSSSQPLSTDNLTPAMKQLSRHLST
ncbi:hypothetical protein Tco_0038115 [Tanacetum coccineum]